MLSKVIACLLCLTISAGAVGAQESPPRASDRLKQKIESTGHIYKRMLLRQYDEYISSLEKDIAAFREMLEQGRTPDAIERLNADIEGMNRDLAAAVEKARSLRADELAAAPPPSKSKGAQLPCHCPTGKVNKDAQEDPRIAKKNLPAGVIWCGPSTTATLNARALAERAAPILWFSPNEPLLQDGNKIPEPLPGDDESEKSGSAVVYYRISEMVLSEDAQKSKVDITELRLDEVKKLTLKYYFYYSEDKGFHGHRHDLESVRLDINFTLRDEAGNEPTDPDKATHYVANISRVIGAAHGVTWYGNQLDIGDDEKDTSLPITLLVEEGKHATSPDRNADGSYSPGYDVNQRYTDAWGVRDLIGSGELGSAKYEGSMTKPRRPANMLMIKPSEPTAGACLLNSCEPNVKACLLRPYAGENREVLEAAQEGYTLKRAEIFETNAEQEKRFADETKDLSYIGKKRAKDSIVGWMESEKFGEVKNGKYVEVNAKPIKPKMTRGDGFFKRAVRFGFGVERDEELRDAIPIAYRLEGRQHGITIFPPIFRIQEPFFGGYIVPKMNFMLSNTETTRIPGRDINRSHRYSLEAMYTPSASRTFDWYASLGREWFRPDPSLGYVNRFVTEGGIRFRVDYKQLWGVRFGLRATGFSEARNPRFVIELGTGAF